jgi:hypothetical protein
MKFQYRKRSDKGVVMIWFSMLLLAIIAITALVADRGNQRVIRHRLQNAADTAALYGVQLLAFHNIAGLTSINENLKAIVAESFSNATISMITYGLYDPTKSVYQSFGSVPNSPDFEPVLINGVAQHTLANALSITLSTSGNNFFGKIFGEDTFGINVTSTAIFDAPESHCVAPLAIPICGLTFEEDKNIQVGVGISASIKKGDFWPEIAARQEIIFGSLPLDLSNLYNTLAQPNNPPVLQGNPELIPGTGLSIDGTRVFPLRGGFGISSSKNDNLSQLDTFREIVDVLKGQNTSITGIQGCRSAKIGERVYLLEKDHYFTSENTGDTFDANQGIVNLINERAGGLRHHSFYSKHVIPSPPPFPSLLGCHSDNIKTSSNQRNVWEVKVPVVIPTLDGEIPTTDQGLDYCSNTVLSNDSQPVIIGFISVHIFDTQLYVKAGETYNCRGIRAKPSRFTGPLSGTAYRAPMRRPALVQ